MDFEIDFLFRTGHGYDDLVHLVNSNPRYVFEVKRQDSIDKRTTKSKQKGWVQIRHKQHEGEIKLSKENGICRAIISDRSGGLKLIGAWTSWLASNANEIIFGLDVRFS